MNKGKNQNSILVLATLGVYLGLVLAGATPQVLAQAAMTRQFDVKDEVEVKDDLDKKPHNTSSETETAAASETNRKITKSVERFLAGFTSATSASTFIESSYESRIERPQPKISFPESVLDKHAPLGSVITITNLPRAGLYSLLATDAK